MKLVYENQRGKIVMQGGGSDSFNIIQIKGLSLPENDVSVIRYPNIAGQEVKRATPMERFITISADVRDENRKHISHAMSVFSSDGVMYITTLGKTKKIRCRCVSFDVNKSKGAYVPFTIQLCADSPYFEDMYETTTQICERNGLIKSPFILGCAFSERLLRNKIVNRGDIPIEPLFKISSDKGSVCPEGIVITNHQNGTVLKLNTDVLPEEVIVVDVKNRKITSSIRGNLITCIANDNSIADFLVDVGVSSVEVSTIGATGEISVQAIHNNSYISAVV